MASILLMENDAVLATILSDILITHGYVVEQDNNKQRVIDKIKTKEFDLLLLDAVLSDDDGFDITQQVKKYQSNLPIILMSTRAPHADIIKGFQAGASDYVTKPFHFEELLARIAIRIQHRQLQLKASHNEIIRLGQFVFYYQKLLLVHEQCTTKLSYKEAELLKCLCDSACENVSKYDLMMAVWQDSSSSINHILDVYIAKLRSIFKYDADVKILNIRGFGYKLICQMQDQ